MKIVFVGTPEYAVPTLRALLESRHEVALVVTQPDRPAGRGRHAHAPPVKTIALAHNVAVIQPDCINQPDVVKVIQEVAPDVIVVVAYGHKFGKRLLSVPRLGCYNIHASLLPHYRGAAPVHHAILGGDAETGVTIQHMAPRIDAGAIVAQHAAFIYGHETTGELAERLAVLAANMITPTLDRIERGEVQELEQDLARVTFAPKLRKADGRIRWDQTNVAVCDFVRAMTPWPGAFAFLMPGAAKKKRRLILLEAQPGPERRKRERNKQPGSAPGKIVIADNVLAVASLDGLVTLVRVIPEGGKPMTGNAYIRGHAICVGEWFHDPR